MSYQFVRRSALPADRGISRIQEFWMTTPYPFRGLPALFLSLAMVATSCRR